MLAVDETRNFLAAILSADSN